MRSTGGDNVYVAVPGAVIKSKFSIFNKTLYPTDNEMLLIRTWIYMQNAVCNGKKVNQEK